MTAHQTLDALLAAVTADAGDVAARFALADLLAEQGLDDEADEVRQQAEAVQAAGADAACTARALLAAARDGEITAEVTGEESLPALADRGGPDCYPCVDIRVSAGDWAAETIGWKVCWWEMGPNRRSNGVWIGHGWRWLTDDDDSVSCGRPTVTADADHGGIEIQGGGNVGDTVWVPLPALEESEVEEVADAIREALDAVYEGWEPQDADDDEIVARLPGVRAADEEITAEVGDETLRVGVYAGNHAGRSVYAVEGLDELYDDAGEAVEAARDLLAEQLETARDVLRDADLSATADALRRAASDE